MRCDLVVIGAGPAGMAAAAEASARGLDVIVLDEQARAGGQIYRDVDRATARRGDILGADYAYGAALTGALRNSSARHVAGAVVWSVAPEGNGFTVLYTRDGRASEIDAARVVLATGALERPMPVPGWTLPGVMTAGAAQILLKQSGVVAERAVLVGCGPLLYLVAAQMVRAGVPPLALVETQSRGDLLRALRHAGGMMHGWRSLAKGAGLLAELRRAGVPRYIGATHIAVAGTDRAEAVCFRSGGRDHRIDGTTVLLHHGVAPNTQAARSLGITHRWNAAQVCFAPVLDIWGGTDVAGVFIAGDGAGIGGAKVAEYAGRLAALEVAKGLGRITDTERDAAARPIRAAMERETAIRPFLDAAYPPYAGALTPDTDTIVCRCEEVTAGAIRRTVRLGSRGPNQTKSFERAGMGPCQGRYCGLTVTAILAHETGQSPDETGYFRIRPPIKPVTLGALAAMQDDPGHTEPEEMLE